MRRVITIALVLGLSGLSARTRAEDPLLIAIDELTADGRCEEALTLLDHANASQASLDGRRALCEARTGRTEEAVAHVSSALRAPNDAWVAENREALLSAIGTRSQHTPRTVRTTDTNPYRSEELHVTAINPYVYGAAERTTGNPYIYAPSGHVAQIAVPPAYETAVTVENPYRREAQARVNEMLAANPYYYDH